ncbi:MAG: WD40 repeat domain-containing protein, partial [Bacteroidota bacterium]
MRACIPHMAKFLIFFSGLASLAAQRAVLVTPMGHSEALASFVYSGDGRFLVTASNDRSARIWENNSRKLLFTLNGHSDALTSASFNPNGNRIVTASADGSACLWNAWTGEKIFCLPDHRSTVFHAGFTR